MALGDAIKPELANNLRRNLTYHNFMVFVNRGRPIGHDGNRVILSRCVVIVLLASKMDIFSSVL